MQNQSFKSWNDMATRCLGSLGQQSNQIFSEMTRQQGQISKEVMATFNKNTEALSKIRTLEDVCTAQREITSNNSLLLLGCWDTSLDTCNALSDQSRAWIESQIESQRCSEPKKACKGSGNDADSKK